MKKYNFKLINKLSVILASFLVAIFFCFNFDLNKVNKTYGANSESHNSGRSLLPTQTIFVHSPTYSVVYHKSIYFIDEYDNMLKNYNQDVSKIVDVIPLSELGEIIDVAYLNEHMIVLSKNLVQDSEKLQLTIINLPNFIIEQTLTIESISTNYSKIDICDYDLNWIISLTPNTETNESSQLNNPILLIYNKSEAEITNVCEILLEDNIKNSYFKLMTISATNSVNDLFLVNVYGNEICFFGCMFETISTENSLSILTSNGSATKTLLINEFTTLVDVNKIIINEKLLFINTYSSNHLTDGIEWISTHSEIYEYIYENVSDEDKEKDKNPVKSINHLSNSSIIMISNGYVVYPIQSEQKIAHTQLTYSSESEQYTDMTSVPVKNPILEIEYYTEDNFKFVTANKKTVLLNLPWEPADFSKGVIIDPSNNPKDLIIIGEGKIEGENSTIENYKYCLYTTVDKNLKGFIKTEDLTLKDHVEIKDYEYKVFKVQPNTILYSMPTTIVGDNITPTIISKKLLEIQENSKVEVINPISNYISNEKRMLKVKVNGLDVGYIEYDKIIKPSEKVNFIITNASIKTDNTNIYLNSDTNSPIIYTLNKGYRIRINGARNTDSGYTSITFNDEYGNEFSGYILTDSIGSDSWTTMQIIGCVLIAINIGLLILILRFKKNSIGTNGVKYLDKQK